MTTNATLYRDGKLMVEINTDCENHFYGLRGRAVIVVCDADGNAIGVTEELCCTTRGGILDPFTPSFGKNIFSLQFPQDVGERAVRLDIMQRDNAPLGGESVRIVKLAKAVVAITNTSR
jgi:hypothetical protein